MHTGVFVKTLLCGFLSLLLLSSVVSFSHLRASVVSWVRVFFLVKTEDALGRVPMQPTGQPWASHSLLAFSTSQGCCETNMEYYVTWGL